MNQKLRYVGLLAILPVFATAMISNFATVSALEQGNGANRHSTALYDPYIVCGDQLCTPLEKKAREHGQNSELAEIIKSVTEHAK